MKRVVVGLSGGVDSSVAAYLLKKQGYEVIGIFMRNWNDASATLEAECPWVTDSVDAMLTAEKLGIPFQVIDLSEAYKERIVDYMFGEYARGRTPNPDVLCNREIKFDLFLKIALELGADYVATGHYCQKEILNKTSATPVYRLMAGADLTKDQSYFLCQLNQFQLSKALFPIGGMLKTEVRQLASELGLVTANKKDSQGLCFIGHISLPQFLQQQLAPKEGNIIEIPKEFSRYHKALLSFSSEKERFISLCTKIKYTPTDGRLVGTHNGAHYFTIGQRKGLKIGGMVDPLFVIEKNVVTNDIYVGQGHNHPGLYSQVLFISHEEAHWIRTDLQINEENPMAIAARIRYRQPLQQATLHRVEEGYFVVFQEKQEAIAEGQFCAVYKGDELIFSGVIGDFRKYQSLKKD